MASLHEKNSDYIEKRCFAGRSGRSYGCAFHRPPLMRAATSGKSTMSKTADQSPACGPAAGRASPHDYSVFALLVASLKSLQGVVERQRQRKALGRLSDHQLRDIGVSAEEARRCAAKPFWRR
jgi:uncharacterized protein YjiS (DUF1127 family)